MAKVDEIRYADLTGLLEGLGYVHREMNGDRVVWEHPEFAGALLVFPPYRPEEIVWAAHVGATRGTLAVHGLLDRDDFDRWRLNLPVSEPPNGQGASSKTGHERAGKPGAASS